MVISLATFALVETVMRQSGEASARIDAVQRGRGAMDTVTRQLRSQACLTSDKSPGPTPRAIEGGTPTSVTFYADMRDVSNKAAAPPAPPAGFIAGPERRQLSFEQPNPAYPGKIVERRWLPRAPEGGPYKYADPPLVREIMTNVIPVAGQQVFEYYSFDLRPETLASGEPPAPKLRMPEVHTNPLSIAEAQRVAKITISYRALPSRKVDDLRASTVFSTDVFVRTVDPNAEPSELNNPCL
jgi:hypothetical protein